MTNITPHNPIKNPLVNAKNNAIKMMNSRDKNNTSGMSTALKSYDSLFDKNIFITSLNNSRLGDGSRPRNWGHSISEMRSLTEFEPQGLSDNDDIAFSKFIEERPYYCYDTCRSASRFHGNYKPEPHRYSIDYKTSNRISMTQPVHHARIMDLRIWNWIENSAQ
ncbi:hypothetical protein RCL_jg26374.t1 [Rhizophagus clarus]|uniref:Uncharacterized protein n=1 Tax=Rhizophagus clarus TaxID=94130 RepID=A0A8H3QPM5_9GLOM|nr:hypothetical protein RCL_jg26374.t1 [Rhizophagus clarus]